MSLYGTPAAFSGSQSGGEVALPAQGSASLETVFKFWFLYLMGVTAFDEVASLFLAFRGGSQYYAKDFGGLYWAQLAVGVVCAVGWTYLLFRLWKGHSTMLTSLLVVAVVVMFGRLGVNIYLSSFGGYRNLGDAMATKTFFFHINWVNTAFRAPARPFAWIINILGIAKAFPTGRFFIDPLFTGMQAALALGMSIFALVARKPEPKP